MNKLITNSMCDSTAFILRLKVHNNLFAHIKHYNLPKIHCKDCRKDNEKLLIVCYTKWHSYANAVCIKVFFSMSLLLILKNIIVIGIKY